MKFGELKEVTGVFVKESYEWLEEAQMGCSSICFASDAKYNYAVCIGWTQTGGTQAEPEWQIAWKIGRQTHNNIMQCDFDIDFEMPYSDESGDVDDTSETIEVNGAKPCSYKSWADLASNIRHTARRIEKDWCID